MYIIQNHHYFGTDFLVGEVDNGFKCRYDNVPPKINKLRCKVNYHALQFLPEIEQMADRLVSIMRNRTGTTNPFMLVFSFLVYISHL